MSKLDKLVRSVDLYYARRVLLRRGWVLIIEEQEFRRCLKIKYPQFVALERKALDKMGIDAFIRNKKSGNIYSIDFKCVDSPLSRILIEICDKIKRDSKGKLYLQNGGNRMYFVTFSEFKSICDNYPKLVSNAAKKSLNEFDVLIRFYQSDRSKKKDFWPKILRIVNSNELVKLAWEILGRVWTNVNWSANSHVVVDKTTKSKVEFKHKTSGTLAIYISMSSASDAIKMEYVVAHLVKDRQNITMGYLTLEENEFLKKVLGKKYYLDNTITPEEIQDELELVYKEMLDGLRCATNNRFLDYNKTIYDLK